MKFALSLGALLALSTPSFSFASPNLHRQTSHPKRLDRPPPSVLAFRNSTERAVGEEGEGLQKRSRSYNGRGSFFNTENGNAGACGTYSKNTDMMVALDFPLYGDPGAVSPFCFKQIIISYGGKTERATILDACEGCGYGGIDMTPTLFSKFADRDVGIIYLSWQLDDGTGTDSVTSSVVSAVSSVIAPVTSVLGDAVGGLLGEGGASTTSQPTSTSSAVSSSSTTISSAPSSSLSPSSSAIASSTRNSTAPLGSAAVALASSTSIPIAPPSERVGGNLDALSQIILGMGSVIGAAAQAGSA